MRIKRVLFIVFIIFMFFSNLYKIYAAEGDIVDQGKSWIDTGEGNVKENSGKGEMLSGSALIAFISPFFNLKGNKNAGEGDFTQLAGMLQGIGIFIIAIVGVVLGIRFMIATPNNKAKVKEALIIYLVGSVIIIAALGIWQLMISIFDV